MRRIVWSFGLVLVAGCAGIRSMFNAHASVAASAGGVSLSPESLAVVLTGLKGARLAPETADFVANLWVNYHLFGQAVADGAIGTDSAAVNEVMWPEITERLASVWHDTVMARHTDIQPATVDREYARLDPQAVRLVQHILVKLAPNASDADKAKAKKKIDDIAAKVRAGVSFGKLALTMSDDPMSARDSGYMDPAPRGAYVTSFDSAAWTLQPGAVSGVVESPYGYHLIRRPPLAEIRGRFQDYLARRAGMVLDSTYFDSLARAKHLEVASKAPEMIRQLLADPEGFRHSSKAFATFDGGKFDGREMARWINALPPQFASSLGQAPDSMMRVFVRRMGENYLFVADAKAHGIALSAAEWDSLRAGYLGGLDSLRTQMTLGDDITNPSASKKDREAAAALKVDAFLARGFGREIRMAPIPSPMVDYLRDRYPHSVNTQGTARAVELALALQQKEQATEESGPKAGGAPQLPTAPAPGAPGRTPAASGAKPAK
jgi:hypothetical protein